MIGIDTNILVRLLINDNKAQAKLAAKIIQENSVFIPKSVLLETEWVLRYTYNITPKVILEAFKKLLGLSTITIEDTLCISQSLEMYEMNFDFADALHLSSSHATEKFATLDKNFIKKGKKLNIKFITLVNSI